MKEIKVKEMKRYKVRKGLESNFLIKGMQIRYFFIWVITGVMIAFYLLIDLLSRAKNGTIGMWLFSLVIGVIIFYSLRFFLLSKSKTKRYAFSKKEETISNKDILKYL